MHNAWKGNVVQQSINKIFVSRNMVMMSHIHLPDENNVSKIVCVLNRRVISTIYFFTSTRKNIFRRGRTHTKTYQKSMATMDGMRVVSLTDFTAVAGHRNAGNYAGALVGGSQHGSHWEPCCSIQTPFSLYNRFGPETNGKIQRLQWPKLIS